MKKLTKKFEKLIEKSDNRYINQTINTQYNILEYRKSLFYAVIHDYYIVSQLKMHEKLYYNKSVFNLIDSYFIDNLYQSKHKDRQLLFNSCFCIDTLKQLLKQLKSNKIKDKSFKFDSNSITLIDSNIKINTNCRSENVYNKYNTFILSDSILNFLDMIFTFMNAEKYYKYADMYCNISETNNGFYLSFNYGFNEFICKIAVR